MLPFLLVLAAAALLRGLGRAGVGPWASWRLALIPALSLMFVLTGAAHFTALKGDLARLIPAGPVSPQVLVAVSGVIQFGGGLALLVPRARTAAAWLLIVLEIVKLPINWNATRLGLVVHGPLPTPPVLRVPLVLLWIVVLVWIAARERPARRAP